MRRAAVVAAALLLSASAALADGPCPDVTLPPIALPHLRAALQQSRPVEILALGSSSTVGARASDPSHAYPAILEEELEHALPTAQIRVVNRGINGQDADEMLARLDKDVLTASPTLVIWQLGANGAMRHVDPAVFQRQVDGGVRRIEAIGADVVLMDNQRSPAVLASPEHAKIDQALADVAVHDGARLFARGRLMDLWQDAGHPYAEFLDGDGVHHNDRGYLCVARALASAILEGLGPNRARLQASQ